MRLLLFKLLIVSLLFGMGFSFNLKATAENGIISYTIEGYGQESIIVVINKGDMQIAVEELRSVALPYKGEFIVKEDGLYEISVAGEKDIKKATVYSEAFKEPIRDYEPNQGVSKEILFIIGLIFLLVVGVIVISFLEKKER